MAKGKVSPNNFYGVRVWQTLDNEKVWYEANRFMGREMVLWGVGTVLLTMGLAFFLWTDPEIFAFLLALFVVVGSLVFAIRGLREAGKIFKRVTKEK